MTHICITWPLWINRTYCFRLLFGCSVRWWLWSSSTAVDHLPRCQKCCVHMDTNVYPTTQWKAISTSQRHKRQACMMTSWHGTSSFPHYWLFARAIQRSQVDCRHRISTLRWRHNERDGVSSHQPHDCLRNRLFRRRSKETLKLHVTGLCAGNSPVTGYRTKGQ